MRGARTPCHGTFRITAFRIRRLPKYLKSCPKHFVAHFYERVNYCKSFILFPIADERLFFVQERESNRAFSVIIFRYVTRYIPVFYLLTILLQSTCCDLEERIFVPVSSKCASRGSVGSCACIALHVAGQSLSVLTNFVIKKIVDNS